MNMQRKQLQDRSDVAIVGGGPAGMTAALLLARAGHRVTVFEASPHLGGLWSSRLDDHSHFRGDNSCKVYQNSYHSTPHLFELIGTTWQQHFTQGFDLTTDWLRPFAAACSWRDLIILSGAYAHHLSGGGGYHRQSVAEFMESHDLSESCQDWLKATALGGVAGTLRMTMWELFHRMGSNGAELLRGTSGPLFWNAQPPNSDAGFVPVWRRALAEAGVTIRTGTPIGSLTRHGNTAVDVTIVGGETHRADAVLLAVPPPALARLMANSEPSMSQRFGLSGHDLQSHLRESVYEHVGISWFFDQALPTGLPSWWNTPNTSRTSVTVQRR